MTEPLSLHLVVPGLLGPMPSLPLLEQPPRPALLEQLLARARPAPQPGYDLDSTLCALFGIRAAADCNLPTAPLRRLGDGGEADSQYWLQVSPVYLRPDQDRLLLFDAEDLALNQAEAEALAQQFNEHFVDEGWRVELRHPQRWFLPLPSSPDLKTYEVTDVFGRNMDLFLPEGEEGLKWRGVLNEIQMLFFQSEVNAQREAAGKGLISGLWLSGGGRLPGEVRTPMAAVFGDSPLLKGLSRLGKIPLGALPDEAVALLSESGPVMVCDDRLQRSVLCADPHDWSDRLARFEAWLAPLVEAMKAGNLSAIHLYPCNGSVYRIDRGRLRRFWRRRRPLGERLDNNNNPAD